MNTPLRPVDGGPPWFAATIGAHLAVFAVPAVIAWRDSLNDAVYVPLVTLPAALFAGVFLLFWRRTRQIGGLVIGATVLAGFIEVALTVLLVLMYSSANPAWDLS